MGVRDIFKRITGTVLDSLSQLLPSFSDVGAKKSEEIIEDTIKGSPSIESALKHIYEHWIKGPFKGWFEFVASPKTFEPQDAVDMSKTFIPLAIGATLGAGTANTALEMLPFGFDSSGIDKIEGKLWSRLGITAATAATFQSPVRLGLNRNLDYFYNSRFLNRKLDPPQAYDSVRFREFLTEDEWSRFESVVKPIKPVVLMSPKEIEEWAAKAASAVDGVEGINSERFGEEMKYHGYKAGYVATLDRAAKRAPSLMMLRQMAMRGFFDPMFMARSIFKGGFDNWAIKPTLQFLAYMAQEGTWVGYREAAQSAYVKGLITEKELRGILERIHVPEMLIGPIIETQKLKTSHTDRELTTTQLLRAYRTGSISEQECKQELQTLGYSAEAAQTLIDTEISKETLKVKLPTLAQFSRALREGIINEEEFKAYLEKRGYENKYVQMLLDIEKAKYPIIKPKLTYSKFVRAFREGVIDEGTLTSKLSALGFSLEEIDIAKKLEIAETKTATAHLSKAEILKALSLGYFDFHTATTKLQEMGYSLEDIEILYVTYKKTSEVIVPD